MKGLFYSYLWLAHSDTFCMYRKGKDFICGRVIDGDLKIIFKHKEATDNDIKLFYRKYSNHQNIAV